MNINTEKNVISEGTMRRYLFIVNPVAGKGRALEQIPKIKEKFDKERIDYEIKVTKEKGEGEKLAREGIENGFNHIIAVGGDGTAYEVVNGIRNEKVVLGILPAGTGNDFARMLKMPKDHDDILETIKVARKRKIDIGLVNDRYFLNCSSVGIDAEIVKETEYIKKYVSGTLAYILGVLKTLIRYRYKEVDIEIDGKRMKKKIELMAVSNGKYYGGGMKINPMADFDDGFLDICIVNRISKIKFAMLFLTVFKGKHVEIQEVETLRGKEIKIYGNSSLMLNADGDIIGTTPAAIKIEKRAIEVIVSEIIE